MHQLIERWIRPALIFWTILLFILSVMPGKMLPSVKFDLWQPDKLGHAVFYAIFAILIYFGSNQKFKSWRKRQILAWTVAFGYGLLMEFIQWAFFPDRFFEWADAIANGIGALFGILSIKLFNQ